MSDETFDDPEIGEEDNFAELFEASMFEIGRASCRERV